MEIAGLATTSPVEGSEAASTKLAENFDTFLKLLTTQLQYQDPLEPMKSNEFVSQLVQFTQVEQAIEQNKSLDRLLDLQTTNQTTAALNYIGSAIEANGAIAPLQDGQAEYGYTLDEDADATLLVISDADGVVVSSAAGETLTGAHKYIWDGLDRAGKQLPPGNYRLTVTARDAEGALLEATTTVAGKVTGVRTDETGAILMLDDVEIPLSDVSAVRGSDVKIPLSDILEDSEFEPEITVTL
jgi:flagellar basal-body rod modification protein FlgD